MGPATPPCCPQTPNAPPPAGAIPVAAAAPASLQRAGGVGAPAAPAAAALRGARTRQLKRQRQRCCRRQARGGCPRPHFNCSKPARLVLAPTWDSWPALRPKPCCSPPHRRPRRPWRSARRPALRSWAPAPPPTPPPSTWRARSWSPSCLRGALFNDIERCIWTSGSGGLHLSADQRRAPHRQQIAARFTPAPTLPLPAAGWPTGWPPAAS